MRDPAQTHDHPATPAPPTSLPTSPPTSPFTTRALPTPPTPRTRLPVAGRAAPVPSGRAAPVPSGRAAPVPSGRAAPVPPGGGGGGTGSPLVLTDDDGLRDEALTAVAAAGTEAMAAPDLATALPSWRTAAMVLLGIDRAQEVLDHPPRPDRPIHLLGDLHDRDELCRLSAQLCATVTVLPDDRAALIAAIRQRCAGGDRGALVAVQGASGGVGSSTLAAGLAWRAHDLTVPTVLVDLDPYGGGLDLVLGAESEPGWRWPRLMDVTAGVSELTGRLPRCEGLPVLAAGRDESLGSPGAPAVGAVLDTLLADHELTVTDVGRDLDPAAAAEVRHRATAVVLLVRDDVRGVAAAATQLAADDTAAWQLLLCRGPGVPGLPRDAVAEALDHEVTGTLPYDRSLRTALLRGVPPWPAARRPWRRQLDRLLAVVGVSR